MRWTLLFIPLFLATACGVKGPPLPPMGDTPSKLEQKAKTLKKRLQEQKNKK